MTKCGHGEEQERGAELQRGGGGKAERGSEGQVFVGKPLRKPRVLLGTKRFREKEKREREMGRTVNMTK